ncbi:MAG: monofunctional biosynthetic peptidoglycan transglycosylase [Gammaproteobacteria bacterium]|nr:monofunctional biosynthetic peptidoglycan transglycosylase [Gammaproteobacteria bacterium]
MRMASRKSARRLRPGRWVLCFAAGVVAFTAVLVLPLRWLPPLTSSFMIITWATAEDGAGRLRHQWTGRRDISRRVPQAVLAAEDQKFFDHHGFDFESIRRAVEHNQRSRRTRGASTISQQVAKNLFLWPGRSWLRKGLEAWFTLWLELALPKARILELYVNVAQFGPTVFGVEAASRLYFGKSAARLNRNEAALLAAVLPNPVRLRVTNPSTYVRRRQAWIMGQSARLERAGLPSAADWPQR